MHLVLRLRGGGGLLLFRCFQGLNPLPAVLAVDAKSNNAFNKRPRSDLKDSQIHVVNYSGVAVQLYLYPTWGSHFTDVAGGASVSVKDVALEANGSLAAVIDRAKAYGHPASMYLPPGGDQVHDVPKGFKPEAFVVGGTIDGNGLVVLRNGCQLNVPARTQLDVMPGFLQSPASDPCTEGQARSTLDTKFDANPMRRP